MARAAGLALLVLAFAPMALAQQDDPPEYRERGEMRDAYRRGYESGFERGYRKGLEEGERRAAQAAAPPPPVATGPIRITGAFYGTNTKNCDATRQLSRRANGKKSFSLEVSNDICGDPARGQRKALEVTYFCGGLSKKATANEHRTLYLDCSS